MGFEFFVSDEVEYNKTKTENIRFERLVSHDFTTFYFDKLWSQERYCS